jgi:hypothetical protein
MGIEQVVAVLVVVLGRSMVAAAPQIIPCSAMLFFVCKRRK